MILIFKSVTLFHNVYLMYEVSDQTLFYSKFHEFHHMLFNSNFGSLKAISSIRNPNLFTQPCQSLAAAVDTLEWWIWVAFLLDDIPLAAHAPGGFHDR